MNSDKNNPSTDDLIAELVLANGILVNEGILDPFGHISVRDPNDPSHFFLSRRLPPILVTKDDIQRFDLDGETLDNRPAYLERYIHSEIFKARPDVNAVIHSHSPSVLPYCFTDQPLRPVTHMAGFLGEAVPTFEIRDTHGAETDLFGNNPDVCGAIAASLGDSSVVLMRRHGVVNVGTSIRQVVFRAYYTEDNARSQTLGMQIGSVTYLSPGEIKETAHLVDTQINRGWEHWSERLRKATPA